jgi:hypothetical protein
VSAGIFDDERAAAVRADWERALAAGRSLDDALKLLADTYLDPEAGPEDDASFWFAVAVLELDARGTVNDYSRDVVLDLIPRDLAAWRDAATPEDYAARERVLSELAERLQAARITRYQLRRRPRAGRRAPGSRRGASGAAGPPPGRRTAGSS